MRKKVTETLEHPDVAPPPAPAPKSQSTGLEAFCSALEEKIKDAYEQSITITEAEKLAGEFLHAQMYIARALQTRSLDARMRKQGVKAIRAGVYLEGAMAGDKKPSDVLLNAQVDADERVKLAQGQFDTAEVEAEALQNYFRIFESAHVYFRQLSRSNG